MLGNYAIYAGIYLLVIARELSHVPSNLDGSRRNELEFLSVCSTMFLFSVFGVVAYRIYYTVERITIDFFSIDDVMIEKMRQMPINSIGLFGVLLFALLLKTSRCMESMSDTMSRPIVTTMTAFCYFLALTFLAEMLVPVF